MTIHSSLIADRSSNNLSRRSTISGLAGRPARPSKQAQTNQNLLHSLSLPALIVDDEGYITDANHASLQFLNKPAQQVISQNIGELLTVEAEVIKACCNDQTQTAEMLIPGSERPRCLELTFSPLQTTEKSNGHLVLFNDVTARKLDDLARSSMIDSLEAYASSIAHDLKSPLATVMGFASLLEMSTSDLSEDHRHYARTIQKISSKMATMIDKLLLFATLEKLEQIPLVPLDMSRVAADVVETLQATIKQYKASVTIAPDMPQATSYMPWIEVVLANLISNAIKYGGAQPQVAVTASQMGDTVYYWVHDNGRGLTAEQIDMLFRHSVRFDGRPKGHGQGLMIAHRIVERLGGEIGVSSEPGTGTTFYFTLPAAAPLSLPSQHEMEIAAVRVD